MRAKKSWSVFTLALALLANGLCVNAQDTKARKARVDAVLADQEVVSCGAAPKGDRDVHGDTLVLSLGDEHYGKVGRARRTPRRPYRNRADLRRRQPHRAQDTRGHATGGPHAARPDARRRPLSPRATRAEVLITTPWRAQQILTRDRRLAQLPRFTSVSRSRTRMAGEAAGRIAPRARRKEEVERRHLHRPAMPPPPPHTARRTRPAVHFGSAVQFYRHSSKRARRKPSAHVEGVQRGVRRGRPSRWARSQERPIEIVASVYSPSCKPSSDSPQRPALGETTTA